MPYGPGAGVAVDDLDLLRVDAEAVGDDLGEARLEALAVRRGAGVDRHRAGRVHAHGADSQKPACMPKPLGPTARDGARPQISM